MKKRVLRCSGVGLALLLQCLAPPSRALACVVGTGTSASCSESALDACLPGGVRFDGTATFSCGGTKTIIVTSTKNIWADTTIDGGSLITISGGNSVRVFSNGVTFTVKNLTIADGYIADIGGGIANGGTLTVTNSTFSNNWTVGNGMNSGGGSGISNLLGQVTVNSSTFSGNIALDGPGAGIFNWQGQLTVTNSTFFNNSCDRRGAVFSLGGAIYSNGGTLTVTNSTLSSNSAVHGGGIYIYGNGILVNTIVAYSTNGLSCAGSMTDGGHNIDDGTTCGFSATKRSFNNTDPKLDPAGLAANGGPTQTIALQADSPAINAGDESVCSTTTGTAPVDNLDQRGFVRPGTGATKCSIGAFEANVTTPVLACVVGTGTSASCSESALDACLPGGGSFTGNVAFNCGGTFPITVTSTKLITADTTIDGASLITIGGGNSGGVFFVDTGVKFTVQNLTIANGYSAADGGGIRSGGTVAVTNSTFSGNSAAYSGGAIVNDGGTLTVTNSTFSGNGTSNAFVGGGGGGIYSNGTLTVTNSTFSGNSAGGQYSASANGGAILNDGGTVAVTNSTFSGNTVRNSGGGGIYSNGTLTVTNSTFSGNRAPGGYGGGIANGGGGTASVTNTIVANSSLDGNCDGSVTDGGHNIDDGTTCGFSTANGSLNNTAPLLDPAGLKDNGGPTHTIALCTTAGPPSGCTGASPAINAGDESVCSTTTGAAPVANLDQRGYVRPGKGATNCSIGAFEGSVTANPTNVDISIASVKAIQTIEDAPLIQNKHTMVRVYPSALGLAQDVPLRVTFHLTIDAAGSWDQVAFLIQHGSDLLVVPSASLEQVRKAIANGNSSQLDVLRSAFSLDAVNFEVRWQPPSAGSVQVRASAEPDPAVLELSKANNALTTNVTILAPSHRTYSVLFQRLRSISSNFTSLRDNDQFRQFAENQWNTILATYPIPATPDGSSLTVREAIQVQTVIPPTEFLVEKLRDLFSPSDGFDRIIYVLPAGLLSVGLLPPVPVDGLSSPSNPKMILLDEQASAFTAAHEMGHTYGFKEEYAPTGIIDSLKKRFGIGFCDLDYDLFPYGSIAGRGWDVLGGTSPPRGRISLKPDDPTSLSNFYSFMDAPAPNWAPAFDAPCNRYSDLFSNFVSSSSSSAVSAAFESRAAQPQVSPVLFVRGEITATDCQLDPIIQADDYPSQAVPGSLEIRTFDSNSTMLSALPIGSFQQDQEVFSFVVAVDALPDVSSLSIYRDGSECATLTRTAHSPDLTVSAVLSGDSQLVVHWDASDADGDSLEYSFSYSVDGNVWFPLTSNSKTPDNPLVVDSFDLPGGSGVIRGIVTDGFNTMVRYSAPVDVANKPPTVRITSPQNGSRLDSSHATPLYAIALDPENHPVSVIWSDDIGATVGTGSTTEGTPTRGAKRLIATVSDDVGNTATDSVAISTYTTCVGDCDESNNVTVDELIVLVNIALGDAPLPDCIAGDKNDDGAVTIDEILLAVGNSLSDCPKD